MPLISAAEFARRKNVSRAAVSQWKSEGRLVFVGKLIDVGLTEARIKQNSSHRAKKRLAVVKPAAASLNRIVKPAVPVSGEVDPAAALICPEACNAACEIEAGASEMASLIARHLPPALVRDVVTAWAQRRRLSYVGPEPGIEPLAVTDEWPAHPGGVPWSEHFWFTRPVLRDYELAEALANGAAWRAERGLPTRECSLGPGSYPGGLHDPPARYR